MSIKFHREISDLMQAAYRIGFDIDRIRKGPFLQWFEKEEGDSMRGFEFGLNVGSPEKQFWKAYLTITAMRWEYCFFTDPEAVERFIKEKCPLVVVSMVMES